MRFRQSVKLGELVRLEKASQPDGDSRNGRISETLGATYSSGASETRGAIDTWEQVKMMEPEG